MQKLQDIVNNGQVELKIAIPNSESIADTFSERIGIFRDDEVKQLHLLEHLKNHFLHKLEILNQWMYLHHGMINPELKEK